nr:Chain C, HLA class II histocompatibility antigen gamma chain [Homo sapiens]
MATPLLMQALPMGAL